MRSHLPGYEYIAMYSKHWTRNTEFLVSKINGKRKLKLPGKECIPKNKFKLSYRVFFQGTSKRDSC